MCWKTGSLAMFSFADLRLDTSATLGGYGEERRCRRRSRTGQTVATATGQRLEGNHTGDGYPRERVDRRDGGFIADGLRLDRRNEHVVHILDGAGIAQLRRGFVVAAVGGAIGVRRIQQVDQPDVVVQDALTETGIAVAAQCIGQCCVRFRFVVVEEVEAVGVAAEESASGAASAFAVVHWMLAAAAPATTAAAAAIRFRIGDGSP